MVETGWGGQPVAIECPEKLNDSTRETPDEAVWPSLGTYRQLVAGELPPAYTLRAGHPRLLITAENKAEIREKIQAAPEIWRGVIQDAEQGQGEPLVLACGAIHQLGLVQGF